MFIYDAGNGIKYCNNKRGRLTQAQKEIDFLPEGTKVLVHLGVSRDGQDEMCEGKYLTSKKR